MLPHLELCPYSWPLLGPAGRRESITAEPQKSGAIPIITYFNLDKRI